MENLFTDNFADYESSWELALPEIPHDLMLDDDVMPMLDDNLEEGHMDQNRPENQDRDVNSSGQHQVADTGAGSVAAINEGGVAATHAGTTASANAGGVAATHASTIAANAGDVTANHASNAAAANAGGVSAYHASSAGATHVSNVAAHHASIIAANAGGGAATHASSAAATHFSNLVAHHASIIAANAGSVAATHAGSVAAANEGSVAATNAGGVAAASSRNVAANPVEAAGNAGGGHRRYSRHTHYQTDEMEAYFKECPHPDEQQRRILGRRIGLDPVQIKFWFQNKRTQTKNYVERQENQVLRAEREKLLAEQEKLQRSLDTKTCSRCGTMPDEEQTLLAENTYLQEQIDRVKKNITNCPNCPNCTNNPPMPSFHPTDLVPQSGLVMQQPSGVNNRARVMSMLTNVPQVDETKSLIVKLAFAAMEEMTAMALAGEPLWVLGSNSVSSNLLNLEEYHREFPVGLGPRPAGFISEASRESTVVLIKHTNLVEILMDVNQWTQMFSDIVSTATTVEVLAPRVGWNYNGAIQVMTAELQFPSPLIAIRHFYFARYCKKFPDGSWAVVDVSLDNIRPGPATRCRRRPSGCLIHELPDGYSQVTWIEHVEFDERVNHPLYKQHMNSSFGFGAKRWTSALERQCERYASLMALNVTKNDFSNPRGKKCMLQLAERMRISFSRGISGSIAHGWAVINNPVDCVKLMTRRSINEPGTPSGVLLSASTSLWLLATPQMVFQFLTDVDARTEWDILSFGGVPGELLNIANGSEVGNNHVQLIRITKPESALTTFICQETYTDPTASYIVYAPVDILSMNMVLNGKEANNVASLPSGFVIHPDAPVLREEGWEIRPTGCLLTVGFQFLVDHTPADVISLDTVASVNRLVTCMVERIKTAVDRRLMSDMEP